MAKRQVILPKIDRPVSERPCLIDRCAVSAPATILVAAALMVPVVALIDALR